jgi:hypothetical protein
MDQEQLTVGYLKVEYLLFFLEESVGYFNVSLLGQDGKRASRISPQKHYLVQNGLIF